MQDKQTHTEGCRTTIVSDVPAIIDGLGGTHLAVAAAVLDVCRHERGGRVVGIEGGWGSGKSTVLSLMRESARAVSHLEFVTFDAWSHESDPLRRVFLERLTTDLANIGWIDPAKWKNKSDELAGRRHTSTTTRRQQLTGFGKRLAASLLLVPAGVQLLSHDWNVHDVRLWGAWLLVLSPFLLVLIEFVSSLASKSRPVQPDVFSLFVQNQSTQETVETIKSPDPNSVEFEHLFMELLADALQDRSRRLVVCLDNLDRIATQAALSVWSTLQAFVQLSLRPSVEWADRVWFVVPYDPSALGRLWRPSDPSADEVASPFGDVAQSFLTKTFAIRFSVPPALLADWRGYLQRQLAVALPDHTPDEFNIVGRVYATVRPQAERPPTPRDINQFVNQLGALHRQHGDRFPLSDMAYYVLLRQRGADVPAEILVKRLPTEDVRSFVGPAVSDSLIGLAFGTNVDVARQHLLREPIEQALRQGDPTGLAQLKSLPGFWPVLELVDGSDWMRHEARSIALAAYALSESTILSDDRWEALQFRNRLSTFAGSVSAWGSVTKLVSHGIVVIAKLGGEKAVPNIYQSINATASGNVSGADVSDWLEGLRVVLDGTRGLCSTATDTTLVLPGSVEDWLLACARMKEEGWDDSLIRRIQPLAHLPEVTSLVVSELTSMISSRGLASALIMAKCQEVYDSTAIRTGVVERIRSARDIDAPVMEQCLAVLDAYDVRLPHGATAIVGLLSEGWLHSQLNGYWRSNADEGAASLIRRMVPDALPLRPPPSVGSAVQGFDGLRQFLASPSSRPGVVTKIVRSIEDSAEMERWLSGLDADSSLGPLVRNILTEKASGDGLLACLDARQVVERWHVLEASLGGDSGALSALIQGKVNELTVRLGNASFRDDVIPLYRLVARATVGPLAPDFVRCCEQALAAISLDKWLNELRSPAEWLRLVFEIASHGPVQLPVAFREAAREHAKEVLGGSAVDEVVLSHWPQFQELFVGSVEVFRDWLFDDVAMAVGDLPDTYIGTYARFFESAEFLGSERRFVQSVARPIVGSGREASLRWLLRLCREFPDVRRVAPKAHVDELIQKIDSLRTDGGDGLDLALSELADAIRT